MKLAVFCVIFCVFFAITLGISAYFIKRAQVVEVPFSVEFQSSIKLVDLYEVTMSDGTKCLLANRPDMVTIECK